MQATRPPPANQRNKMNTNYPSTARVMHDIRLLLLLLTMLLTTTATLSATITPRTVRGVFSTSRVGAVSISVASTRESTSAGTGVDHDDDSYEDDYDDGELDTDDEDVDELKVKQTQQQQQQQRRHHQQTVRRETNDETSPRGTGGSSRPSTFAGAPIMTSESRVRVAAGDYAAHGTSSSAMESTASGDSAVGVSREQWIERERKKNHRLFMIQRQIVEMLGLERRPNISAIPSNQHVDRVQQIITRRTAVPGSHQLAGSEVQHEQPNARQQLNTNNMARRYQALLPTCQEPLLNDQLDDESTASLRLHFNCEIFDPSRSRALRIISAILKLKKKPRETGFTIVASGSGNLQRSQDDAEDPSTNPHDNDGSHVMSPSSESLRVSLYSVSRPSVRRAGRRGSSLEVKRLIRSTVVRADSIGWVRLNIRHTLEDWMRRGQTSGTVEVVVTDARRQQIIDASQVFEPRNCSNSPSAELLMQLPLSIADAETAQATSAETIIGYHDDDDDDSTSAETSGSDHVDTGVSLSGSESVGLSTSGGRYALSGQNSNQRRAQMYPEDFVQPYVELVTVFEPLRQPAAAGASTASAGRNS